MKNQSKKKNDKMCQVKTNKSYKKKCTGDMDVLDGGQWEMG